MNKPNLFIPGFPKSGTSSLHTILCQHSEIASSNSKEPHTYSWDERYKRRDVYFKKAYGNLTTKYVLESSTSYMVSDRAIRRIVQDVPEAKFIIVARNPVDRIVSHYNWLSSLGLINLPFHQEIEQHATEVFNYKKHYRGNYKSYIDFSKNGQQLLNLLKNVERESVLFLEYESLFVNLEKKSKQITDFLELEEFVFTPEKVNATKEKSQFVYTSLSWRNRLKYQIRKAYSIIRDRPFGWRIKDPKPFKTDWDEAFSLCYPYLKEDIKLFQSLNFKTIHWKSLQ